MVDATIIADLKRGERDAVASVLRRLIAEGRGEEAVTLGVDLLTRMREELDALHHKLQVSLRMLYGRRSEKLSAADRAQLAALLSDNAATGNTATDTATNAATSDTATSDTATSDTATSDTGTGNTADGANAKPAKKPLPPGAAHGRGGKPSGLPEREVKQPVPEGQRCCPQCQGALHPLKPVTSWRVEYEPGHFFLKAIAREQLSCRRCRDVVVTAPMPPTPIAGAEADAGLLAKVLVDKGEDHLPIERQQRRLAREGLTVPTSTLMSWWSQAADLLRPLATALRREAMTAWLPQIDGTGLDVLDRLHPHGIRQGTIWTTVGGRAVAFVFTPSKSQGLGEVLALRPTTAADDDGGELDGESAGPRCVLPVQCDGEPIFGSSLSRLGVFGVLVHCWMHARRYFEKARKARDPQADLPLALIGRMYEIERRATEQGVSLEERTRRRQSEVWPLLESLRSWAEETRPKAPPSTPLGRAIGYLEARWLSLCVFVLDGRIPMDNGEVERFIRRIAVGRNNWLFSGSDEAAERLCTVASLCATCRKLGIDPWRYLSHALLAAGSGMTSQDFVAGYTPWAWAEQQAKKQAAERAAAGGDAVMA
jgi:transposase